MMIGNGQLTKAHFFEINNFFKNPYFRNEQLPIDESFASYDKIFALL